MSELACKLKFSLMKFFEDIQFAIDIACQAIINKRKNEGLPYVDIEQRYIHEYIRQLKAIDDASMDKLNKFIEKEEGNLELLSRDEIFLKAGCESVVYVEFDEIRLSRRKFFQKYFQEKHEFVIGAFLGSPFWLNQNQANYIRVKLQDTDKSKNINIILDKVSLLKS